MRIGLKLFRKKEMFDGYSIDLSLLRKYHENFFNDNALKAIFEYKLHDLPADIYRLVEFMQGRTKKDVGGRSYRANVQASVKLHYYLYDIFVDKFPIR